MQNVPPNALCQNGHPQPAGGTKFCIYCGVAVVQLQIPPTPQAMTPAAPQQPQQYQPQLQDQYQQQQYIPLPVATCGTCGGEGRGLPDSRVFCKECRWLRPLVPGYGIDTSAFAWAADAKAMAALRKVKPLNAAAKAVSEKVGRRWVEVSFNAIALGEKQLPHVFGQALRAARILGMSHMPDVYISGDRPWECLTFGSDKDSFIVIGSAVAGNFQGVDLLYLLAREMGHCKAGHALWKTVIRFFLGEQGPAKGFMAGGIFNAIISPTAMIGGAIEMPLLAWARQAEITADRAGLIAVGSETVARRTLLSLSLRSSFIFKQINIQTWLDDQEDHVGDMVRLSELTSSSTPYLGPRMKLLHEFATSPEYLQIVAWIKQRIASNAPPKTAPPKTAPSSAAKPEGKPSELKIKCSGCQAPMRIPMSAVAGKPKLSVKCPNAKCGKITVITKKPKPAGSSTPPARIKEENQNYAD